MIPLAGKGTRHRTKTKDERKRSTFRLSIHGSLQFIFVSLLGCFTSLVLFSAYSMTASDEDTIRHHLQKSRRQTMRQSKRHMVMANQRVSSNEGEEAGQKMTSRRVSDTRDENELDHESEPDHARQHHDFSSTKMIRSESKSRLKELIRQSREKRRKNRSKLRGNNAFADIAGGIFSQDAEAAPSWRQRLPERRRKGSFIEQIRRSLQLLLGLVSEDDDFDTNAGNSRFSSLLTPPQLEPEYSVMELRSMHSLRIKEWNESGVFYDFNKPTMKQNTTLSDPIIRSPNDTLAVIVLSSRSNEQNRNAIRETWGKNHSVFFVVGGSTNNESSSLQNELFVESSRHRDMIDSIHPESYISLPFKLHTAYRWIVQNMPSVRWILKADDDSVVRVATIEHALLDTYNPNRPLVFGKINPRSKVSRKGKWREFQYEQPFYPYWPQGSRGHVVSRPIAQYLSDQSNLTYYQGEDTSLGIWLDQSNLNVSWVHSLYFQNHGRCKENEWLVIGHKLSADDIRSCYEAMDEWEDDQWEDSSRRLFYMETRHQRKGSQTGAKHDHFLPPDIPPELTESRPDDAKQFQA